MVICFFKFKLEGDEDLFFDDDWVVVLYLYVWNLIMKRVIECLFVMLLVMVVGGNVIFDLSKEELVVVDVVLVVLVGDDVLLWEGGMDVDGRSNNLGRNLKLLFIRMVDLFLRLMLLGVVNVVNSVYGYV